MTWTNINLQPHLIESFKNIIKNNRLAHAYIFYGPENSPKDAAALEFAKAINCEQADGDACDQCRTCLKIDHGNHPDIVSIQPQGAGIKIDQLRELKKKFHYQVPSGLTRIVIIKQAEQMRLEAANSLLKFLEEPPSPMVAILLTEKIQSILPTIQSRCQKVRFPTPKRQYAQNFPSHLAEIAGQFTYSLQLNEQRLHQLCTKTIEWSNHILSRQQDKMMVTLLDIVHHHPDEVSIYLDHLLFWLRELVYFQMTGQFRYYTNWADDVQTQAGKQPKERLLMMIENIMIARRLLDKPANRPQAVLEQMILAICKQEISQANGWQLIVI